jgi:beta-glucosidase
MPVERRRLQVWDGEWVDLPGSVGLLVGRASDDLPLAVHVIPGGRTAASN